MHTVTKMAKICQIRHIHLADFPVTNLTKISSNFQFCQANFAVMKLTIICQNCQIHEHSLSLIDFFNSVIVITA